MDVKLINRVILSFSFYFSCFATAQNLSPKQIDSLSVQAIIVRKTGGYQKYYKKQLYILKESQKIKYSKGIALSHLEAGAAQQALGNFNESVKHFSLAEKEIYVESDFGLKSELNRYLGESYHRLGLYDSSIKKHKQAILLAEKVNNGEKNILKAINYNDIGASLERIKNSDSVYYYYGKAFYFITKPYEYSKEFSK